MIEELRISPRLTKTEHTNKHAEKSCTEDTLVFFFFFSILLASSRSTWDLSYLKESEVAQSCPTICDPMDCRLLHPWDFPGKSIGVGCHSLLQGIFQTQGLNLVLPHCRQMLLPSEPPGKSNLSCEDMRRLKGSSEQGRTY